MAGKWFDVTAEITVTLTEHDIEDLVVTALDGGVGYWACLDNTTDAFKAMTKEDCVDAFAAKILIEGGELVFLDAEDYSTKWTMDIEKLCQGVRLYIENGYDIYGAFASGRIDMGEIDAERADMIFQLALFDDLVYG